MDYSIDLQKIADALDFDLEDVEMLIEVFLESTEESLGLLKTAIQNNDLEEIFKSAHAIKGSSANLTLVNISNIAKEIEKDARDGNYINYIEKYEILNTMISNIKR
jgi:HPt (histidine-containing phosphotransfer) domain-containing protein